MLLLQYCLKISDNILKIKREKWNRDKRKLQPRPQGKEGKKRDPGNEVEKIAPLRESTNVKIYNHLQ